MAVAPRKILIIRLSSIGDIVLTSPIIRSLHRTLPKSELHFLTKRGYAPLLQHDPRITKVHMFDGDLATTIRELQAEGFDFVLDLHRNLRSRIIRLRLSLPSATYTKDRWPVMLHTRLGIGKLPEVHTVERYARTLPSLGCTLDDQGLEFFLPQEAKAAAQELIQQHFSDAPIAVVIGGNHATKRWPRAYFVELLNALGMPVLLLGGKPEAEDAEWIADQLQVPLYNAVAQHDLLTSAAMLPHAGFVLTHDTGFMHIGTALGCKIFSLWGNTVPGFGFSPYKAAKSVIIENKELSCRPCSKLGYEKCPKGHFKCMNDLTPSLVLSRIRANL